MSSFSCYTHHICSPTDTACFFDSRIWYMAKEYYNTELKLVGFYEIFSDVNGYSYFLSNCSILTATFACFLDNQQWIIHYWNILYFLLTGCAQVRVSVLPIAESRLSSPGSWFIAPSQAHKWTNTKLESNERTNQPKLILVARYNYIYIATITIFNLNFILYSQFIKILTNYFEI